VVRICLNILRICQYVKRSQLHEMQRVKAGRLCQLTDFAGLLRIVTLDQEFYNCKEARKGSSL
jgi:hypothetical protein